MKNKPHNFVALDLGSSKIAGATVLVDEHNSKVLHQSLQYSEGMKSGAVMDVSRAEHSIVNSIYNLERLAGNNIQSAAISLTGSGAKSHYIYNSVRVVGDRVMQSDLKKLVRKMLLEFPQQGQEIVHYFPIEYIVDKNSSLQNPIGIYGNELGCRMHVITVDKKVLLNLASCLAKCQVEVQSVTLGVYAAGLACLTEDERDLGAVVIDLGACTTTFAVFLAGKLLYTGYIPVGGNHITSDIAKIFSVNMKTAERLKVIYGSAVEHSFDKDQVINLDELEGGENAIPTNNIIHSTELTQVVNARIVEIFEMIKKEYDRIGVDHMIARRVVLTGGGAGLRNLQELVASIFDKQVRIGKPQIMPGFAEDYNPGTYAVLVGMIKEQILRHKAKQNTVVVSQKDNMLTKIVAWFKDNI